MRTVLGLATALAAVAALLALTAGQALAQNVHCGDVITQDTTLDSDLLGCAYPALTVGADHVRLDLNRHVVEGGVETPFRADGFYTDLLIENGTVRGGGISISYYEDVAIRHVTADGINVAFTNRARIARSVVRDSFIGVGVGRSNDVTISDDVIERNGTGISGAHTGLVTLIGNIIRGNQDSGVSGGPATFHATANRIVGNGADGFHATEGDTVLRDNLIAANGGYGVHAELEGLVAEGNAITRNGRSGVYETRDLVNLTDNIVSRNVEDGIRLGEFARGTVAENRTDRNGDDGIAVDGPGSSTGVGVTLTGNHAWFNGDLGIEALPSITTGWGNWAKHNGNPAQCIPGNLCSKRGKPKK